MFSEPHRQPDGKHHIKGQAKTRPPARHTRIDDQEAMKKVEHSVATGIIQKLLLNPSIAAIKKQLAIAISIISVRAEAPSAANNT
jgi:hypothetical protein